MRDAPARPTDNHLEILLLAAAGKSQRDIATILDLPISVARSRCKEVRIRLQADSMAAAVYRACRRGWL